jgi:putative transposase
MEIVAQLSCLATVLDAKTLRQLGCIVTAMLTMSGRVTMLGLSRWSGKGGSYRTIQRFFHDTIPWAQLNWCFFRLVLWRSGEEYLLVGDESVVTKAGRATYGLDRFFSSLYGKPVPGLAFLALSLVSVEQGRAYPLIVEQRLATKPEPASPVPAGSVPPPPPTPQPKPRGRPKGTKNKDKSQIEWTAELRLLEQMLRLFWTLVGTLLGVRYLVLDGHFGNNNALQLARQTNLQLVSKLRHDAALYLPYDGPYAGRGPRRKYGERLNPKRPPLQLLKERTIEGQIQTEIYQAPVWHKSFPQPLNVVIIIKTNLTTNARAHVILFSSELSLTAERLIRCYRLRFQIEFTFRDAKQFWGLEDFMTVTDTAVINAASLALFMVNLSYALLDQFRKTTPDFGITDLKAYFRGRFYAVQTLNA